MKLSTGGEVVDMGETRARFGVRDDLNEINKDGTKDDSGSILLAPPSRFCRNSPTTELQIAPPPLFTPMLFGSH